MIKCCLNFLVSIHFYTNLKAFLTISRFNCWCSCSVLFDHWSPTHITQVMLYRFAKRMRLFRHWQNSSVTPQWTYPERRHLGETSSHTKQASSPKRWNAFFALKQSSECTIHDIDYNIAIFQSAQSDGIAEERHQCCTGRTTGFEMVHENHFISWWNFTLPISLKGKQFSYICAKQRVKNWSEL